MSKDTAGKRFEKQVLKTLKGMGIKSYGEHGQISLQALHPGSQPGGHLEIDIVCLIGNVCILVETTIETNNNSEKIKRFIRHCELVVNSPLSKRALFSIFEGIPAEEVINFTGISDWHYLYIGTAPELITDDITPDKYPDTNSLHIFNEENWEYFKILERTIKETAKYEFLASVDINPSDIGDTSLGGTELSKPFLDVTNKILFSGQRDVLANLFVVTFTPNELLRIARVLRCQGQPMAISSETSTNQQSGGYQRILMPDKLKKIRKFIGNNSKVAFPTNLTLVLNNECEMRNSNLHIPSKYASIDVIDGQHRLFSYALSSEEVREEARLIATAIKFDTDNAQKINQYAARTFITINSEQTKVKRDLIYLISYDVLDDKTPESIAAKILKMCDSKPNGILTGIFALRAFIKKNKLDQTPIPIISIIRELAKIFKTENLGTIRSALGEQISELNESEFPIQTGRQLLEHYFSQVKHEFPNDWENVDSLLMCAKYIGAFIKLLETFIEEGLTVLGMREELGKIKQNILQKYQEGRTNEQSFVFVPEAFHSYRDEEGEEARKSLPSKRGGSVEQIYKLLNESRQNQVQS